MLRRVILVLAVIFAGLSTGYYSEPLYDFIWPEKETKIGSGNFDKSPEKGLPAQSEQLISKGDAINSVKNFPAVEKLEKVSELDGTQLIFEADQEPTQDFPVWVLEIKERHPDKLPESSYFQVDAVTGKVLNLIMDELKISGTGLSITRKEVEEVLGRPEKSDRVYDRDMKQTVRISSYNGLKVIYDSNGRTVRLTVDNPEHPGPRGIKVGDSKTEAIRMFGKAAQAPTGFLIYNVEDDRQASLVIKLGDNERIVQITIQAGQ